MGLLGCLLAQLQDFFGLTAMATCIFNVVKAGLYACQDFKYMAVASLWAARQPWAGASSTHRIFQGKRAHTHNIRE